MILKTASVFAVTAIAGISTLAIPSPTPAPQVEVQQDAEYIETEVEDTIEVTRWVPQTTFEKVKRKVRKPIYTVRRRADFSLISPGVEIEDESVETVALSDVPMPQIRGEEVVEICCEPVPMRAQIMSAPRVIKEGRLRTVRRNDNFVVDGFAGGITPARKPTEGFGGVQVGLLNRNNQPLSNAVMDYDREVTFQGPNAQRLNSVQADVDGDFGSEEAEAETNTNVGPVRRLLKRRQGGGRPSGGLFRG